MAYPHRSISLLLLAFSYAHAQDPCLTPANKIGSCIELRECKTLLDILTKERPPSQETVTLLRNSQCGFSGMHPKVCCAREEAPSDPKDPVVPPLPADVTKHPNLRLLNHDICGPITQQKIVGGFKTGVFEYPWMALLAFDTGGGRLEFRCGGSVINKKYILTAAHCVTLLPDGLTLSGVRIGEHDLSTERDCDRDEFGMEVACAEKYQDFRIEEVHFHPGYTRSKLQNDIALIRLKGEADFRPANIRPICLPIGSAARLSSKRVTVTGWGATEYGTTSQDLLQVRLLPVKNDECAESYKRSNTEISYKQMCAGGKKLTDSCLGDSGGPLQAPGLYNETNFRFIQYGIVSFGLKNCGTEGFPGVYTRLTYYLDWILNTMRE